MPSATVRLGPLAVLAFLGLAACSPEPSGLAELRARGELRVGAVNEPTVYYLGAQGPQGFDYRLARAFADHLGVQLIIVPARDRDNLRELLAAGRIDIAAAALTADSSWKRVGLATTTYRDVEQLVVQRRGHTATHNIAGLNGARVVVREGSPQLELLRELHNGGATYLAWTELPREQADPLDWVNTGDADFAIVDRTEFAFARHLYPEASVAFSLPDPRPVQWLVRRSALELRDAANAFIAQARPRACCTTWPARPTPRPAISSTRRRAASRMTSLRGCRSCVRCLNRPPASSRSTGACWPRSDTRSRVGTTTRSRPTAPPAS